MRRASASTRSGLRTPCRAHWHDIFSGPAVYTRPPIECASWRARIVSVEAAASAAASLALSPPAPRVTDDMGQPLISRDPSGYDASLRWAASPGAVSYRVYWRAAWSSDWQREQTVSNVTRFVLPNVSIDDFVFGVAAIGPDGQQSLISAYVSPDRPIPPAKLAN